LIPFLLEYRDALKRASTYGLEWAEKHVDQDGRVRSDFQQIGAISGRISSSSPNLQNIPRDPRYRACFRPAQGRVLVKADYNQIELRAAAAFMSLLHDDRSLADAFRRGEDVHSLVAREVLGVLNPTKKDRQRAKAISFGQLYGQGVEGFRRYAETQFGVKFTLEEARQVLDRFFRLFPGFQKARAWAYSRHFEMLDAIYTLSGRRILNPVKLSPQERLNLPVQGSAADGLKAALGLLWERRSELPEDASLVLCVHDEIVMECWKADAEEVVRILREAMIEGMQRILRNVPVEVEVTVCQDWAGAPVEQGETREGGGPIAEQPLLEGAASEEGRVEELLDTDTGQPVYEVKPTEDGHGEVLDPRALVSRLARVSPGPHHHVGEWTLGLCPACGKRTVAWRFHPPEVVTVCGCSVAPGLVRADRLPVEPVTIR
jgi:DNA polymerase-1